MKSILYIVAIVAILAGAGFSFNQMSKFDKLKNDRLALDSENENRKANIKSTKKKANVMEEDRKAAKAKFYEAEKTREDAEAELKKPKNEIASLKRKIASADRKIKAGNELVANVKEEFKEIGQDVQLEDIPALMANLESDLEEGSKKLEETQTLADAADKRVNDGPDSTTAQLTALSNRLAKRASNIAGNTAEGRITAVNHDWGFVTLEIPSNMPVTPAAKLMIKRGMAYIGNLEVNAIEGRRIVADIDYKSMTRGMVVQPGDNVILVKPATN